MKNISLRIYLQIVLETLRAVSIWNRVHRIFRYSPWIVCALRFFSLNILRQASQTRLTFSLKFLGLLWVILSDIYTAFIFVIALNFLRVIFQTPQIYKKSAAIYVVICNKTYPLKLFDSQNPTYSFRIGNEERASRGLGPLRLKYFVIKYGLWKSPCATLL